jgi:hypothetical protein
VEKKQTYMNNEQKNKFIELRVKGDSLGDISEKLGIPKTTLWRWDQEEKTHINQLQLAEQEEFESDWGCDRENKLSSLHNTLSTLHYAIVHKLDKVALHLSVKDLFVYMNLVRSEIDHYRIKPLNGSDLSLPGGTGHRPVAADNLSGSIEPAVEHLEQNGTIPFQNGTSDRSTTPSSPLGDEMTSPSLGHNRIHNLNPGHVAPEPTEQNGTISFQNGTANRPTIPTPSETSLSSVPLRGERVAQPGEGRREIHNSSGGEEETYRAPHLDDHQPSTINHQRNLEQNGTIPFQNGTPNRSTTPSPSDISLSSTGGRGIKVEDEINRAEHLDDHQPSTINHQPTLEQNGTIPFQNGTLDRSTTPADHDPSLSPTRGEVVPGRLSTSRSEPSCLGSP